MGVARRLDEVQRRRPALGFPLAVAYKFFDDQGVYLAALITYYGFLSVFPVLLLLASILGFVLQGNESLRTDILDSTISQFPVLADQLRDPQGLPGSGIALVVGALTALYGALGVAQAVQNAANVAWAVPRHRRPNPLKARGISLLILATGGLAVLATTTLSLLAGTVGQRPGALDSAAAVLAAIGAVVVNTAVFSVVFRIATARRLRLREVVPGAACSAVVWQLLQVFGSAYVAEVVRGQALAYGVFAVVLGLLAWTFLAALGVVVGIEINVVAGKRLYPRALLTPFTDRVDLTAGDQEAYSDAATAQRYKGFEDVTVSFRDDGQHASAIRRRAARVPDDGGDPADDG